VTRQDGTTPLDVAVQRNKPAVAALLREVSARALGGTCSGAPSGRRGGRRGARARARWRGAERRGAERRGAGAQWKPKKGRRAAKATRARPEGLQEGAGAARAGAAKKARQAGALTTFLRQECGLQEQQAAEVADRFALPEFGVLDTATLFALKDEDLGEIVAPLPLGPSRLVVKKVKALRD
jgi:hypothetical protein